MSRLALKEGESGGDGPKVLREGLPNWPRESGRKLVKLIEWSWPGPGLLPAA